MLSPVSALPNPGSVGLHEAMGFQPLGVYQGIGFKNGSWHDVLWLQLQLRERASEPDEPRVFLVLQNSEEWREALASGLAALPTTGGRSMSG